MASATMSVLAGYVLSPLGVVCSEKLIGYLWDYLSSAPSPSSSSVEEAERQQQLKDSLEALEDSKLSVRSMQSRIMKLFEKHKQNERVVGLHNKLKDMGYDIQDLESEMRYMQLERKVAEINMADQEADTSTSTRSLKRLFPFRRPTSSSSTEKKRRLLTSSQSSHLSTDDEIVGKVTSIVKQINSIESKLKDEIKLEEWFDLIKLNGVYDPREQHHFPQNKRVTTSSTNERKIYGREGEKQLLIEFLTGPNEDGNNISVVPIVGLAGMGKTALAQSVFNSREIENHFNKKAWIYVSKHFDRARITKEMVNIISPTAQRCCSTTNLDLLERELKRHLTLKKKFLLVLDDVWSDKWQQLLTPLQSAQAHAIKIIVTCRYPTVLRSIDEGNQIILKGLSDQDYWSLFVNCAFAENNPDNYPRELHDIGKCIVGKLKGSPLAAKTVGKLLGRSLTEKHWKDVLESDLWKLETDAHDIMPALALSYYHLPPHLQQCFVFLSLFPKNSKYYMDEVISMWIANGYIHESGSSSKAVNDIGKEYYHELKQMCFFDDSYPHFHMHDLMHDLAQLVSHGEICIYESGKDKKISKSVRHLYVKGLIDLELVCETNNLRTLVLERAVVLSTFLDHEAFKRIRVLIIADANMQEFPNAICHLKHLQYLDFWDTCIKSIPESLCGLYQLRVLKLPPPQILPSLFGNLINLQYWHMHRGGYKICIEGTLIYNVERERGYVISQLRNMNELRGALSIGGLENINNTEEAMKSKLKEKRHIKKLCLHWNHRVDSCKHDIQEEVLEGLQPHPNLEELQIDGYMGSKTPSWLMKLQKLQRMDLCDCRNWACLPATLGLLPSLKWLVLCGIENLTVECDDSVTEMFPSLERLDLSRTTVSFKGMPTSSSSLTTAGRRKFFPRLQYLDVNFCDGLNGSHWLMSSALERLFIRNSPGLDDQLLGCLHGISALTTLHLSGAKIKTFPAEVMATLHALVVLHLDNCNELLSVEGLQALPSLRYLEIYTCPKFRSWCIEEMTELHDLYIKSCQDLESLPVWLHRLPLLKGLSINSCPKFHSLPVGGVPSSLERFKITECDPGLMERCQQEQSPEWQMIQHIPKRIFNS